MQNESRDSLKDELGPDEEEEHLCPICYTNPISKPGQPIPDGDLLTIEFN